MGDPREKALRLVKYLSGLVALRSKVVRDVSDYEHVLWLHKIPHEKGCFTQAWGQSEEYGQDVWLEIRKANEPVLPKIPDACKDWVDRLTLHDSENLPKLRTTITTQLQNPAYDEATEEPSFIIQERKIEDYPKVEGIWQWYLEKQWIPWAELHKKWKAVQNVYSQLFAIHQEQLRLGEEHELVLGIGLLSWKSPDGHRIRRHLVTAKAALEFEPPLGRFAVGPSPDGANISPEMDMLGEHKPSGAEDFVKNELSSAADNPWDRSSVETVLEGLAKRLSHLGEYHPNLEASVTNPDTKPVVEFAPALILRKRSTKGLSQALNKMQENIESGGKIPTEFKDLAEITSPSAERESSDTAHRDFVDETIYFPKPSNEEQRQIIEKLQISSGVLVQGPPGTGKSHTIANLICHLLATGQRVLVTAKTPRALLVLNGLIPKELRPLCINLLGSSREEQRSLEESVDSILTKDDTWNDQQATKDASRIREEIDGLREEKAEIDKKLRDIREAETREQLIVDGAYRGTAAIISRRLAEDLSQFEWFKDSVRYDQEFTIKADDLMVLLRELRNLPPDRKRELSQVIPDPSRDLPNIKTFGELVQKERVARDRLQELSAGADVEISEALMQEEIEVVKPFHESLATLEKTVQPLQNRPEAWVKTAVEDILSGNQMTWHQLADATREIITKISNHVDRADEVKVELPADWHLGNTLKDAYRLTKHLENGGRLGWGPFRSKAVKQGLYIIKGATIDERPCKTPDTLTDLTRCLLVKQEMEHAWSLWQGYMAKRSTGNSMQLAAFQNALSTLDAIIALEDLVKSCKKHLKKMDRIPHPVWHDAESMRRFINASQIAIASNELRETTSELESWESKLTPFAFDRNAHPHSRAALDIIRRRETDSLACLVREIEELKKAAEKARWAQETTERLKPIVPVLIDELVADPKNVDWDARLSSIEKAWKWARAKSWLKDYLSEKDDRRLQRRVEQIESEIGTKMADLSALHAWRFCFSRMKERHRKHLSAWRLAIRKVGKGTGKHAPQYRRDAQQHLNECREAVPAWVMPLHRIWDTVQASPEMFDVIIVDEASQCGPEALPLFYLGKKILIVGDDQQISPEAVGIPLDAVHSLMKELLHDFEFKDSFDVKSSLFDHGRLRYGTRRITLRVHFRCMPEIIRFSNDLCYRSTSLIAVRQYPPDRLEPLKKVFVNSGYREGTRNRVFNRPEAEAIVRQIVECCNDRRYSGKTMGVITLQGESQGRLIEDMLLRDLGAEEMDNRRLICGNPYSFQGDERHVIFLSMVAAPNERIGPLTKAADQRRINVAASRAQDQMWLFYSASRSDLSQSCLRRRLVEFFEDPVAQTEHTIGQDPDALHQLAFEANRSIEKPPSPFDSWFEVDVFLDIIGRGYRVIPQFEIARRYIDLVIEGSQARLAVECDGDCWHGLDQYEQDMARQRMLERCGWEFWRIRESAYCSDREGSLRNLWSLLEKRGIFPASATNSKVGDEVDFNISDVDDAAEPQPADHPRTVRVGDTVVYVDLEEPAKQKEVQITTRPSAAEMGIINQNTPVARALVGASPGDEVTVGLPMGEMRLRIIEVR